MVDGDLYRWSSGTVGSILRNPVYAGDLTLLKTEVVNHKTGQIAKVDEDRRVIIPDAHEPIISREIYEQAEKVRAEHHCPARMGRENLFRGLLFCDCCGHPLTLSRKKLKDREVARVPSLGREVPLEKEMATHSSILAWRIPWTEEPGGLQSTGWQRVGHD